MKGMILGLGLFVGSLALAADLSSQLKPANEYCFIWAGDQEGEFVDRKEIRFVLDPADPVNRTFHTEVEVDDEVKAEIFADSQGYRLSLFKHGRKNRPLATGFYNRTGVIFDFNTTGFEICTDTATYSIACVTESFIE